jgi:aprataxin
VRADLQSLHAKEELLKTPLTCFKCGEAMGNMPLLKRHLEEEFATEAKSAARQR